MWDVAGVYKFPYPLTTTLFQLAITHVLLVLMAGLTRLLTRPFRHLGFNAAIAPSHSTGGSVSLGGGLRGNYQIFRLAVRLKRLLLGGSGIAGGGVLEFDWRIARQVLPLAVVFVAKVVLGNLSFA
jgi:hypothetical protein